VECEDVGKEHQKEQTADEDDLIENGVAKPAGKHNPRICREKALLRVR